MWPMGWKVLEQWGDDVAPIEPLAGGVANDVWTVRVNGQLARWKRGWWVGVRRWNASGASQKLT